MGMVAQAALQRFKAELGAGITVDLSPDLPLALGYGPWLEEVFANLIGNAIKYIGKQNPAPRIAIRGSLHAGLAYYAVQDNGIGIQPEDQARLFEMFTRFHHDQATGLGLGLSIVQRIVVKLNGTLGVESTPGQGSTFWFALPAVGDKDPDIRAEHMLQRA
jgi:two-component system sensor histidine kinase/response regulator